MKLLDKKTVNANLAKEKKTQIDQGMELARKVDSLRETKLKEEGNLERFRRESIAAIQIEIDRAINRKNQVLDEIKEAERQRKALLLPLDAEWKKITDDKRDCEIWRIELGEQEAYLEDRQREILNEEREVELEKGRIEDVKHRASENLIQTESALENARKFAAEIRLRSQRTLDSATAREKVVIEKETALIRKEAHLASEAAKNLDWQKRLAIKEIQLRDREQTLLRNKQRNGNRRD